MQFEEKCTTDKGNYFIFEKTLTFMVHRNRGWDIWREIAQNFQTDNNTYSVK